MPLANSRKVGSLKPGDRIRCDFQLALEVVKTLDAQAGRFDVRILHMPLEETAPGQYLVQFDSPQSRVLYDGNIAEIESQIQHLLAQKDRLTNGNSSGSQDPHATTSHSQPSGPAGKITRPAPHQP